jgi:hypothetical protein
MNGWALILLTSPPFEIVSKRKVKPPQKRIINRSVGQPEG